MVSLLVSAFMLIAVTANPALAQETAKASQAQNGMATTKVLAENDKVLVLERRYKPGDENQNPPNTSTRVVRVLKGGTLLRTYANGKTEKQEYKTGDTRINVPGPQYTGKNVGKSEIVLYVLVLK